jgi:glycosyltransferase involved in cell wall biosynthesis
MGSRSDDLAGNHVRLSVIISTWNAPDLLEKCLWGFSCQDFRDFEIVVADDGSDDDTSQRLRAFQEAAGLPLQRVWHEHRGFRKTVILNKAIVRARSEYLVFTDGDCIPRRDFLSVHASLAETGHFLSGGCFRVSEEVGRRISRDDVLQGLFAEPKWLRAQGVRAGLKWSKLISRGRWPQFLDRLMLTKATWNGHNASGWKRDLVEVNGFDERMQYGGLDRELGERLSRIGIRARRVRYRAVCVHLGHRRTWVDRSAITRNARIREENRTDRRRWTEFGIRKDVRSS